MELAQMQEEKKSFIYDRKERAPTELNWVPIELKKKKSLQNSL